MNSRSLIRGALVASFLCCAMLSPAGAPLAAPFPEFVDPNPAAGNQFGATVMPLGTGNVVITSPFDDAGGVDAGAVYLFNGSTGALIGTLRGSTADDNVGSGGVTALANGNYVVCSPYWDNGANANAGAATWGSGTTGVTGVVSAANSLVGSSYGDRVGYPDVTALSNGNYVVRSPYWNNGAGAGAGAGAVTWGSGTTGVAGVVSAANSLVGSSYGDQVGFSAVTQLSNSNYVVGSPNWQNGAAAYAGAATWGSGTTGVNGVVSAANSLVGSTLADIVGLGVTPLSNGNYVVVSTHWDDGAVVDAGAATWGSGTTGVTGMVSAANSLVGSTANDNVGNGGVAALSNSNYVVRSFLWNNGAVAGAGAVTWGDGTTGMIGTVSAANSLVGTTANDNVGSEGVKALSNGNYVVASSFWDDGATADVGAVTWGSGTAGVAGAVSTSNSLVGSLTNDKVGNAVTALSNGNFVVASRSWNNGAVSGAGAVTWANGATGMIGTVTAANSLVGTTANDNVGNVGNGGVTALSNGNYVVSSSFWDNGAIVNAGAATWCNGTTGMTGAVSAANSLVGTKANDNVGSQGVRALSNGNYVVSSGLWDNGASSNAGAATWGSGTSGVSGVVSPANSLVGSKANDQIGSVTELSNGNYVVSSGSWDDGVTVNVGAVSWGSGTTGVNGVVSVTNSLIGATSNDNIASVTVLPNGGYVVSSNAWDNGALADAGAATWASGAAGATGVVSFSNSLVGESAFTGLQPPVVDYVNNTFFASFPSEGGGRVRVGAVENAPEIVSAVDIPNDQGGWLRLTFNGSSSDAATAVPPVAMYGVWRHVPGTLPALAGEATPSTTPDSRLDSPGTEQLRAALPAGLDVQEVEGRFYLTALGSRVAGIAAVFPPGTWELVASVPALQQVQYLVAVPTISNAAPNEFVMTAHTTTPSLWYVGEPASGQSVDNLAPAQPAQLTATYAAGQTNLQWAANTEHDLGSYRVYRGTSADFTPGAGNQIATVISPSHADVGPPGRYYKVSAVDVNGNESGFTLITTGGTTGVEGAGPVAFALEGVRPNPTHGNGLQVAFALPSGTAARLELLDVSGGRVLAREVGSLGAGRHSVNLSEGRRVAPGIYWVKLTQGANERTARVAVIE